MRGDRAGNAVTFTVLTIADGKFHFGTRGNNTGSAASFIPGEVDVYWL